MIYGTTFLHLSTICWILSYIQPSSQSGEKRHMCYVFMWIVLISSDLPGLIPWDSFPEFSKTKSWRSPLSSYKLPSECDRIWPAFAAKFKAQPQKRHASVDALKRQFQKQAFVTLHEKLRQIAIIHVAVVLLFWVLFGAEKSRSCTETNQSQFPKKPWTT